MEKMQKKVLQFDSVNISIRPIYHDKTVSWLTRGTQYVYRAPSLSSFTNCEQASSRKYRLKKYLNWLNNTYKHKHVTMSKITAPVNWYEYIFILNQIWYHFTAQSLNKTW